MTLVRLEVAPALAQVVQRVRPWLILPMALVVMAVERAPEAALAGEMPLQVPLECRLGKGPWQPCTMTIEQVGEHWWLQVGQQRLDFRSNGRGALTLKPSQGAPRDVVPVWSSDQALCWDGVCAKGSFPLD